MSSEPEVEVVNDPQVEKLGANAAAVYAQEFWTKLSAAARQDIKNLDPCWEEFEDFSSSEADSVEGQQLLPDEVEEVGRTLTSRVVVTHSSKFDRQLYARFRSNMSTLPLSRINGTGQISLNTPQWQSLLVASDGVVADFSFMTLLRAEAVSPFYMNELEACGGLCVVSRAQFLYIEIARIKEGYYGKAFRQVRKKGEHKRNETRER